MTGRTWELRPPTENLRTLCSIKPDLMQPLLLLRCQRERRIAFLPSLFQ